MIKIENTQVLGWEAAIRGMRNPMNSWDKSDSGVCATHGPDSCSRCIYSEADCSGDEVDVASRWIVGSDDLDLMLRLAKAGSVEAKYRRMITVYADLTAPLYWWKEYDTYKVGTVANSCSTMHKIHEKEFTLEDFSHEHLDGHVYYEDEREKVYASYMSPFWILQATIESLNEWREIFNNGGTHLWKGEECKFKPHDKDAWWQMIQLLPSSYNQRRTVELNYEVLANIYHNRKNHKLDEWRELCSWIETLPYSEIITCKSGKEE